MDWLFFFKQKTAYEMRISDWSSDVCSSDLPLLAPYDPYFQDLTQRLIPPVWHDKGSWAHPLGTDGFGRDYLSRVIYGSRISLLIGFSAMLISGAIGSTLGIAAGYFGAIGREHV